MAAATLFRGCHRRGQPRRETELIGEIGEQSGTGVIHHTGAATSDLDRRTTTITLHHGSALLVGVLVAFDSTSFPHQKGVFADAATSTPNHY